MNYHYYDYPQLPQVPMIYFAGPNSDRRTTDFGTKFKKLLYVLCFLGIVDV